MNRKLWCLLVLGCGCIGHGPAPVNSTQVLKQPEQDRSDLPAASTINIESARSAIIAWDLGSGLETKEPLERDNIQIFAVPDPPQGVVVQYGGEEIDKAYENTVFSTHPCQKAFLWNSELRKFEEDRSRRFGLSDDFESPCWNSTWQPIHAKIASNRGFHPRLFAATANAVKNERPFVSPQF
jgi:hypothetical protein